MVEPLEIKDQGRNRSYFCTGCAVASIAEPYVGEPCDEAYSFAMGLRASGLPPTHPGLKHPKFALKGAALYGVLPKSKSPFTGTEPREFLADWRNWDTTRAVKPFASFRRVLDPKYAFDDGRVTLMAGLFWQAHWDNSPVIDTLGEYNKFAPHEVRILGWEDGYYVIQNSRGTTRGHHGIWYYNDKLPFHHVYRPTTTPSRLDPLLELF